MIKTSHQDFTLTV